MRKKRDTPLFPKFNKMARSKGLKLAPHHKAKIAEAARRREKAKRAKKEAERAEEEASLMVFKRDKTCFFAKKLAGI